MEFGLSSRGCDPLCGMRMAGNVRRKWLFIASQLLVESPSDFRGGECHGSLDAGFKSTLCCFSELSYSS